MLNIDSDLIIKFDELLIFADIIRNIMIFNLSRAHNCNKIYVSDKTYKWLKTLYICESKELKIEKDQILVEIDPSLSDKEMKICYIK